MKKVGHTSEFIFGIYWWTWKTTIKNCWCGPIKNKIILIITILHLKKPPGDIIILHLCTKNLHDLWSTVCNRLKLVILGQFLPFYSPTNPKYQNFEKMERIAGDIIILLMCTKFTIIWCTVLEIRSETEFFVILVHFLPFYPSNDPENQNFEKMKKVYGDTIHLHMCSINEDHMMYDSWNIRYKRHNFYHFGPFFALSPSWQPEKSKFWKIKTKTR